MKKAPLLIGLSLLSIVILGAIYFLTIGVGDNLLDEMQQIHSTDPLDHLPENFIIKLASEQGSSGNCCTYLSSTYIFENNELVSIESFSGSDVRRSGNKGHTCKEIYTASTGITKNTEWDPSIPGTEVYACNSFPTVTGIEMLKGYIKDEEIGTQCSHGYTCYEILSEIN